MGLFRLRKGLMYFGDAKTTKTRLWRAFLGSEAVGRFVYTEIHAGHDVIGEDVMKEKVVTAFRMLMEEPWKWDKLINYQTQKWLHNRISS